MAEQYDTIIAGGGIAGLIAACDLSRSGLRTLVLEAAGETGGRARTRELDGYHFNLGPHGLYVKGTFCATLDDLQIARPGRQPVIEKPLALWNGRKHRFPIGLGSLLRLTPLSFSDRLQM